MSLIRADIPTIVIGMKDIGFANAGINQYNTYKIIKIADPFESYNPLDPVNAITGFEKDAAYFFFSKETIDLTGIADNAVPVNLDTTSGNNVFANMAFAGVAKTTAPFATVGFNTSNLLWIYKVSDPYESYNPNDPYNPIDGFEINECYYGYALANMDLNAYLIPPIVIKDDVEKATDTYKYWGTEATTDKDFYNVPVRFFDDEASLPTTGIENIVYVAKAESTSWYWDGTVYQPIGGGTTTETDPTVPALVKNIPVSADAATNKYLNWNGSAYTRKQIAYSEVSGTPSIPAAYTDEQAQDAAAAMIAAGTHTGITFTYDDAGNKISAAVAGSTTKRLLTLPVNTSTTGTTEQTLVDVAIPANTFNTNGDTGWLQMFTVYGATASTKTFKIYINGTLTVTITDSNVNAPSRFEFWLQRISASNSCNYYMHSRSAPFSNESFVPTAALDFTSAIQFKITIQSTVAGQFTCRFGQMQLLPGT